MRRRQQRLPTAPADVEAAPTARGLRGVLTSLRRRRGLAGDTGWAAAGELAKTGSALLIVYLLATRLGPAEYGYFAGIQALIATIATLSYVWIGFLLLQEVVRDGRPSADAFASGLALVGITSGAAVVVAGVLGLFLLPGVTTAVIVLFAVGELVGLGVVTVAASLVQATVSYSSSIRVRIQFLVLRVVAVIGLAFAGDLSLFAVALSYCVVGLLSAAGVLVWVRIRHGVSLRPRVPHWAEIRTGMSYAGTLLSNAVQEDSDKILLVRFGDPAVAGLYAAAYRLVQMAMLPVRALLASSHRTFLEHDPDEKGQHVRRSLRFTAPAAVYSVLAVVILVVAAPLVPRILGESYAGTTIMIAWLAPLIVLRGVSLFAFNGLMGLRRNGARLAIAVSTGLAAGVGGVLLIMGYSWRGAAVATLASEVLFVVLTWLALVHYQRRHDSIAQTPVSARAAT